MASESSRSKTYGSATDWAQGAPPDERTAQLRVEACKPSPGIELVFSALDPSVAGPIETEFAAAGGLVISNARNHRMDPNVPLIVPEVNPDHLALAAGQEFETGRILTNPNCSSIGLVLALAPLLPLGIRRVAVVSMQALSGAGRLAFREDELSDNLIPHIGGEEEKLEREPLKIFGTCTQRGIASARFAISAQCNRVAVTDGHTLCVSIDFEGEVQTQDLISHWSRFKAPDFVRHLPSAPDPPIHVLDDVDGPQPKHHRDLGRGMAIAIGRPRPCNVLAHKFVTLSHNTIRGAAGGSILLAELALARGLHPHLSVPQ